MKGLDFCCKVIPYPVVLNLRPYCTDRLIEVDRQRIAWAGGQDLIAGSEITIEGPGEPNAALLKEGATPVQVNGAGSSTSADEALRSCND